MKKWYEGNTGNHQGLVIDEQTGESIAVSYKKENARLIAAAPELYESLKEMVEYVHNLESIPCISKAMSVVGNAQSIISVVEGN